MIVLLVPAAWAAPSAAFVAGWACAVAHVRRPPEFDWDHVWDLFDRMESTR